MNSSIASLGLALGSPGCNEANDEAFWTVEAVLFARSAAKARMLKLEVRVNACFRLCSV